MRVEDQQIDIRVLCGQRAGDQIVNALDGHVGSDLPDKPSGVGESELDGEVAALFHIGEEFRLLQQALDKAAPGLQRFRCLEQGRDVQLVVHAILAGEVERAHHGGGVLALGDQEADDRPGIDMFQDLRAHHELAPRRGLFQEQVRKIHLDGF